MAHRTMVMVKRMYLHIAILTMLTAILWLALTIYQSLTSLSDVAVDATTRSPITPSFDEEVFNAIVGLNFEAPSSSASAVTINEIRPSEELGGETTTETSNDVVSENAEPTIQSTEVTTP
ncbi:MAG: hypothetical protein DPW11_00280 [bacterium]|nr:hypothetical protein [bacterium]